MKVFHSPIIRGFKTPGTPRQSALPPTAVLAPPAPHMARQWPSHTCPQRPILWGLGLGEANTPPNGAAYTTISSRLWLAWELPVQALRVECGLSEHRQTTRHAPALPPICRTCTPGESAGGRGGGWPPSGRCGTQLRHPPGAQASPWGHRMHFATAGHGAFCFRVAIHRERRSLWPRDFAKPEVAHGPNESVWF